MFSIRWSKYLKILEYLGEEIEIDNKFSQLLEKQTGTISEEKNNIKRYIKIFNN